MKKVFAALLIAFFTLAIISCASYMYHVPLRAASDNTAY